MLIKKSEINKLKKSIISVFNSEDYPPDELKKAFIFRNDMVMLCDKAIYVIEKQNVGITYCVYMYLVLIAIVGFNLYLHIQNPIEDSISLVMMLHALLSGWLGLVLYPTINEMRLIKFNATHVLTEHYQIHFRRLQLQHPDLKYKLREVNTLESKKGFEASWVFLMKYTKQV